MNSETNFLKLRLGTYERGSSTNAERSNRWITISNCVIASGGEIIGYDDPVMVQITEVHSGGVLWKDNPQKIGTFSVEGPSINLYLSSPAFDHIWTAADAIDESRSSGATYRPPVYPVSSGTPRPSAPQKSVTCPIHGRRMPLCTAQAAAVAEIPTPSRCGGLATFHATASRLIKLTNVASDATFDVCGNVTAARSTLHAALVGSSERGTDSTMMRSMRS
jgi:hypothetical protein